MRSLNALSPALLFVVDFQIFTAPGEKGSMARYRLGCQQIWTAAIWWFCIVLKNLFERDENQRSHLLKLN